MTIRELAILAGVSPTTVSLVLNGKGTIGDDTRERVEKLIRETGFRPSMSSRRLCARRSFQVGVLLRDGASPFDDPFYMGITHGIYARAQALGYNLLYVEYDGRAPEALLNRDVDGVICFQGIRPEMRALLREHATPFAVADAHGGADGDPGARVDYEEASLAAMHCLTGLGHRRVALVTPEGFPELEAEARRAHETALAEVGAAQDARLLLNATAASPDGAAAVVARERPTAVCCPSDRVAVALMGALWRMGVRVPQDVSVVSVDDTPLARVVLPNLTTVRVDTEAMGARTMDALHEAIEGRAPLRALMPPGPVMLRESVRKA